jgi:hypothetical protein
VAIEEGDETIFWLEVAEETKVLPNCGIMIGEVNELVAIFSAARSTAARRLHGST